MQTRGLAAYFQGGFLYVGQRHHPRYSAAELAACAAAVDPARFAAPLVIGHPRTTRRPAAAARLAAEGMTLFAEVDAIDPLLADAIRVGMYRKISASPVLGVSPANPVPGVLYLRQVVGRGCAGRQGPAPVTLSEGDGGGI